MVPNAPASHACLSLPVEPARADARAAWWAAGGLSWRQAPLGSRLSSDLEPSQVSLVPAPSTVLTGRPVVLTEVVTPHQGKPRLLRNGGVAPPPNRTVPTFPALSVVKSVMDQGQSSSDESSDSDSWSRRRALRADQQGAPGLLAQHVGGTQWVQGVSSGASSVSRTAQQQSQPLAAAAELLGGL